MSKAGYKKNPHKVFIVEYSFIDHGERVTYTRISYEQTEEAALKESMKVLQVTDYPGFEMRVISSKEY